MDNIEAAKFWFEWFPWLAQRTKKEIDFITFVLKYEIPPEEWERLLSFGKRRYI